MSTMTPDSLQQVVVSTGRSRTASADRTQGRSEPIAHHVMWAGLDFLTAVAGGIIAYRIRAQGDGPAAVHGLQHFMPLPPLAAVLFLMAFGAYLVFFSRMYGLYRHELGHSGLHEQRMTIQATLTSGLLLCGTLYLTHGYAVSRVAVGLMIGISLPMLMVRRFAWRKILQRRYLEGHETRNVLIVGQGRVAHALRNHLESLRHMGFRFMGFVSLEALGADAAAVDVIGDTRNCVALARSLFVDEIYFSTPADKETVLGVVEEARAVGIEVRVVPDLYDGLAWNAKVEYLGQFPTIPLHRRDFPRSAFLVKRALDIVLASLLLLLLSPVMLAIAVWVRTDSKGPFFYRAQRVGRKGRLFDCYKFRTMVADADQRKGEVEHMNERNGILFKISNDPRVTKVGALLRKYSLDELPQLWNVLKGDMSLVGPRPPIAAEVQQYEVAHLKRLDVLPGMTGLWQVEARQDPSFDSYISLDTAYVENWNLMLDLKILARTVSVVLGGTGS